MIPTRWVLNWLVEQTNRQRYKFAYEFNGKIWWRFPPYDNSVCYNDIYTNTALANVQSDEAWYIYTRNSDLRSANSLHYGLKFLMQKDIKSDACMVFALNMFHHEAIDSHEETVKLFIFSNEEIASFPPISEQYIQGIQTIYANNYAPHFQPNFGVRVLRLFQGLIETIRRNNP